MEKNYCRLSRKQALVSLALTMALALGGAMPATAALTYTTLTLPTLDTDISTWSDGTAYNAVFPGSHTWNGVPFDLENTTDNYKVFYAGGTLTIPVNVFGVSKAFTIINTCWGTYGVIVGQVKFNGSDGASYQVDLKEGVNVRDHYYGNFNNSIDGVNAMPAWGINSSGHARLDMQIYTLPATFADETLVNIVFTNFQKGSSAGNPFIAAATVGVAPIPGAIILFGSGLLGLAAWRRSS